MPKPCTKVHFPVAVSTRLTLTVTDVDPYQLAEVRQIQCVGPGRKTLSVEHNSAQVLFPGNAYTLTTPSAPCTLRVVFTIWDKRDVRSVNFHERVAVQTFVFAVS
jgi:hypothetical protein